MGIDVDGSPPIQGGGKERQGAKPVDPVAQVIESTNELVNRSFESGKNSGVTLGRLQAFGEASDLVVAGTVDIMKLVRDPRESSSVAAALTDLAIKILKKAK